MSYLNNIRKICNTAYDEHFGESSNINADDRANILMITERVAYSLEEQAINSIQDNAGKDGNTHEVAEKSMHGTVNGKVATAIMSKETFIRNFDFEQALYEKEQQEKTLEAKSDNTIKDALPEELINSLQNLQEEIKTESITKEPNVKHKSGTLSLSKDVEQDDELELA